MATKDLRMIGRRGFQGSFTKEGWQQGQAPAEASRYRVLAWTTDERSLGTGDGRRADEERELGKRWRDGTAQKMGWRDKGVLCDCALRRADCVAGVAGRACAGALIRIQLYDVLPRFPPRLSVHRRQSRETGTRIGVDCAEGSLQVVAGCAAWSRETRVVE